MSTDGSWSGFTTSATPEPQGGVTPGVGEGRVSLSASIAMHGDDARESLLASEEGAEAGRGNSRREQSSGLELEATVNRAEVDRGQEEASRKLRF